MPMLQIDSLSGENGIIVIYAWARSRLGMLWRIFLLKLKEEVQAGAVVTSPEAVKKAKGVLYRNGRVSRS